MSVLKTDYKEDIINEDFAADRKFAEIMNADGSHSYNDVTPYSQEGDSYGAKEINHENTHTNYAIEAADRTYEGADLTVRFAEEIAKYANVWKWIKGRIVAANFDGLHIGDYIPIYIGEYLIKMQIAGIDTYYKGTDQQLGHHIDWISKDCYPVEAKWSEEQKNNGTAAEPAPYLNSAVKAFLDGLEAQLPAEVQEVIATKRFLLESRYSASGTLTDSTSMEWKDLGKLWLPSEFEVLGVNLWTTKVYGAGPAVQYPIFANSCKNRIKGAGDGGAREVWWLLSVCSGMSNGSVIISRTGGAGYYSCTNTSFVPICFRITE